ncbi:predicted protein [Histoplasma capsulatum G186AR]|uniref:Uncharacterized protein n=1 Tax=Ajellomyces capsulatus (strain G186AR / H82 / ATCC MYA-2454 / RMSCC 2432) TaxID=447093 RepID=C0NX59_AJECG|nr:uncharacterized protein HCBG_08051 [Histoplasma capsulatum G186AR]EEH03925.1 predicted protein [Histoplasma capsulatum G186AR]
MSERQKRRREAKEAAPVRKVERTAWMKREAFRQNSSHQGCFVSKPSQESRKGGVPEHAADQVDASWLAAFRNRSGHQGTGLLGGQFVRRYDRASGLMVFSVMHIWH